MKAGHPDTLVRLSTFLGDVLSPQGKADTFLSLIGLSACPPLGIFGATEAESTRRVGGPQA